VRPGGKARETDGRASRQDIDPKAVVPLGWRVNVAKCPRNIRQIILVIATDQ
jgi:hypothetical protein